MSDFDVGFFVGYFMGLATVFGWIGVYQWRRWRP